jgi:O-antigen/teichoic acid export membrane protein
MSTAVHRSGLLARNTALNAAGQLLPLLLAVALLPWILRELGTERFAVLTLAWTIVGYFGFFDLGLGRATTRFVAGLLGADRAGGVRRVVWSSLAIQSALGLVGAALIAGLAGVIARDVLRIDDPVMIAETESTLRIVALGLPLVLLSGTFSGVLEAYQRFDLVNYVRVPSSMATLAVPAIGAAAGASLPVIVAGIIVARATALLCFAVLAGRIGGGLRPVRPHGQTLRRLLGFGGWLTVSLVAVPILSYTERLLIGGLRSLTELAYYAVPFEIVARTAVIPSAVALTLFPAFSHAQGSGVRINALFRRPMKLLFLLQWPLLVLLWLFPGEILNAWMGPEVAGAGAPVLRLLALAFFFNAFSQVALAGIQGLGRPDLKAKLDMFEVPFFVLTAVVLIPVWGIAGAAAAKLLVTLVDTVVLFVFAGRLGQRPVVDWSALRRQPVAAVAAVLLVAAVGAAAWAPILVRVIVMIAAIGLLAGAVWQRVLDATDRAAVSGLFRRAVRMEEATP